MHRSLLPLLPLIVAATACAPRTAVVAVPTPGQRLAASIDSIVDRPPLHRTSWGIVIADAASGAVLFERNPDKLFIPASNTKLVVALAALSRLGPEWTYRTPILAGGRDGDQADVVILQGRGDPTWSARVHGNVAVPIDSMAALIAGAGIRRIATLISDASRFTDDFVHPAWEVGDLPWQYAPPIDAVGAGEGVTRIVVSAGAGVGTPATATLLGPLTQPVRVEALTDTAGARSTISVDYKARRDTVHVTGRVGLGAADTSTIALTQPARSVVEALAESLRRRNVEVGATRVVRDPAEAAALAAGAGQIAEWTSPAMSRIVPIIMGPSQNWVAEQVLKTLGAELGDEGSWRGGIAVERAWLYSAVGLDSGAVNLRDASGMSAQNLLTPRAAVEMLRYAQTQTWAAAFRESLAGPGVAGSTLNSRLRPLQGRIAGKTGTISNVNSLSGYLTTTGGRDIVFAIMSNGSGLPSTNVRSAIDDVVLAMARHLDAVQDN